MGGQSRFRYYTDLENVFTRKRFNDSNVVVIVIDGLNFNKLISPGVIFDQKFHQVMEETTKSLQMHARATFAYCHDDKIILFLKKYNENSELIYNGKIQKLITIVSSITTGFFIQHYDIVFGRLPEIMPICSVNGFELPNVKKAVGYLFYKIHENNNNSLIKIIKKYMPEFNRTGKSIENLRQAIIDGNCQELLSRADYYRGSFFLRHYVMETESETGKPLRKTKITNVGFSKLQRLKNKDAVLFNNQDPIFKQLRYTRVGIED